MKLLKSTKSLFLATILLLTFSSSHQSQLYICENQVGLELSPTWINLQSQVGWLQTPNFPRPFGLPLECLWIFDLTKIAGKYLHFYFTQFYLEDNILEVTSLSSSWPLKSRNVLNWTEVDSLGIWTTASELQSTEEDTYILLRMRANSKTYDRLHKRVLEVDDVYGFNITYELLPSPRVRSDVCSLGLCNFNGECFLNINATTNTVGDFFCACAKPKFGPTKHSKEFHGDRCQHHSENDECTSEFNPCLNGGQCRYQSSRYIDCRCPEAFQGQRCEKKVKVPATFASKDSSECIRHYIQVEVDSANLNEVFLWLKNVAGIANHHVKVYKSFKTVKEDRGLIFFKWEHEITPSAIKSLEKAVKKALQDSDLNLSIYRELSSLSFQKSEFCTQVVHPSDEHSRDVYVNSEFSLTCKISGAVNEPRVLWYRNDIYHINSTFAQVPDRITQDTRAIEGSNGGYLSILFVKDTNQLDSGKFTCKVFDVGNSRWVPEALLNQYPSTEAHINVEVVLRPKIDVYPASTTLVKSQDDLDHRHVGDHNTLYCFAHPSVKKEVAQHYRYEWWKDGNVKVESQEQTLIEYQEEMSQPASGSALTIGKIQRDTVYKCRVYNDRDTQLNGTQGQRPQKLLTEIEIPVYVAENLSDTCERAFQGGILWPATKKGSTSITQCVIGQGFCAFKCNPTSPHAKPTWNQHVNVSDCVREDFLKWEKDVDLILSGYVKNSTEDVQLVKKLFHILPDLPGSRTPGMREWQIVLNLLRKALKYASSKSLPLNYTSMAETFYSQSLSSLSVWVRGLDPELGPLKTGKIFQIFRLITESVSMFGRKMEVEDAVTLDNKHGHQVDPCQQGLILVKFARLSLPLRPNATAWIKRTLDNPVDNTSTKSYFTVLSLNQKTPIFKTMRSKRSFRANTIQVQNERPKSEAPLLHQCNGTTSVNISIKSNSQHDAVVGIVHYKDLEDALSPQYREISNRSTEVYQRVSTLVTIIYDAGNTKVDLKVAIRFYDFPIGGPNDTRFGSTLYCASAQLPSNPQNIKEYAMWMPRDPNCQLETDPYGITCTCNKPGTFALMQLTRNVTEGLDDVADQDNEYVLILSCGCSLTLCLLTLMILLLQFMENRCGITLMHAQVTFTLAMLMIAIILKIAKFLNQSYHGEISLCLHYFVSSSLLCQINIPAALFSEVSWEYCYKEFKAFLIALSFLIPALYTGIVAHLKHSTKENWFVPWETKQFDAFISMNLILITMYLSLSYFLVRILKNTTIKKHESVTLIQRSFFITTVIIFLEGALVYYSNYESPTLSTQFILALPCAAMGAVVFWSHVIGGKPGEEEYSSKFPMTGIESIVGGQGSCSTGTNSERSSCKDWRDSRLSTTETTVLNPDSDQSPINNDVSLESGSFRSRSCTRNGRNQYTSTLISKSEKNKVSMKAIIDKRIRESKQTESITATPTLVPCRSRTRSEENSEDVVDAKNNPEPLHSLLNPLVGSQDPIDPFLITKVDIHRVSGSSHSSSCEKMDEKDSEYVLMINNNANSAIPQDPVVISN